jgi:hypothetical protein
VVAALTLLPVLAIRAEAAQVVELFTSQGCDDCPPADALLGEVARLPGVIALAYHVTYWDQLGWHDRFGLPQSDARQQYYVQQLHLSTAFTPQAVIDGRVSIIGSNRNELLAALRASAASIPVALALSRDQLQIELAAQALPTPLRVIVVGYLPHSSTAVGAGENAGHRLEEFDIVRSYDPVGVWHGNAQRFVVPLASLAPEVSRVAVLLQSPEGRIAGAAALAVR